ncbi:MAG: gliding motility-associated C-terminal domain-containing protein, partial [Bacteroidota bacterium]
TDANGCSVVIDNLIVGDQCGPCENPEVLSITTTDATCTQDNGTAVISLNGNPSAYSYTWTNGVSTSNEASNLAMGTYFVTISDISDVTCYTVVDLSIGNVDGPVATVSSTSPSGCSVANGAATLSPNNFIYIWSDNNLPAVQRDDLAAGTYEVTVEEPGNPCKNILTVAITAADDLIASTNIITQPTCGNADGAVNIEVNGGSGQYDYSWEGNGSRTGLPADDYTVTVTDELSGCMAVVDFVLVDDVAPATITVDPELALNCMGDNNGTVNYSVDLDPAFVGNDSVSIMKEGVPVSNGSLGAGIYTIEVRDGNNCMAAIASFTVTEPTAITIVADISNQDCENTASIALNVTGGDGNYSFDWEGFGSTNDPQDLTGIDAGTYRLIVTDGNGCTTIDQFTVGDDCNEAQCDQPYVSNLITTDAECGLNNGTAIIEVGGDVNDYTFAWPANLSHNNEANQLPAGTYTVTITDADSTVCFIETTFSIGNSDAPQASVVSTTAATCEAANGIAVLAPDSLTYQWSDGAQGASRTDLLAQSYQITVTDGNNNCFDIIDLTIEAVSNLVAEATINTQPDCNASNGAVSISVSGGSNDYEYNWGNGWTAEVNRTDLSAGIYNVTVVDQQSNCTATVNFVLTENVPQAVLNIQTPISISCFGAADATVDYEITYPAGFVAPARIEMQDANGETAINGQLSAGNYCIVVWDANDCWAGEACFDVLEPEALNLALTVIDADCDQNGSIDITVTGGTTDYSYDWEDVAGTNNPADRTDLPVGTYQLTVTDANGCSIVMNTIEVENDCIEECTPPVVSNIITVASTCGSSDGSATLEIVGYFNHYDYLWPNGESTTTTATDLAAGWYAVTISDKNDPLCYTVVDVIIDNADGPQATVSSTSPAECTANNGAATLSPSQYDYQWSDGGSGANRDDLLASNYTITITDPVTNCSNVLQVEIPQTSNLLATANVIREPLCGEADGEVAILTNGGSGNYAYSWGLSPVRDDLAAGPYTVTVTDLDTDCEAVVDFVLVEDIPGATIVLTPTHLDCNGEADGRIEYDIDYDYGFERPQHLEIRNEQGDSISNGSLTAGNYCLLVWDNNGCLAGQSCFEILEPEALSIDIALQAIGCTTAGSIDVNVSGGSGDYLYDWADLSGPNNPEDRNDLVEGNYNLTVTDSNGCTSIISNLIIEASCIGPDTIYISTPYETPMDTICLDLSELSANLSSMDLCGDPLYGTLNLDTVNHCVTYQPDPGFIGADTSCVVICDATGTCDTTTLIVTVNPPACTDYLDSSDTTNLTTSNCAAGASYCVEIPLEEFYQYVLTDNGATYQGDIWGCSFDSSYTYSTFIFPSQGAVGPYRLEGWSVNGVGHTTEFMRVGQLVDSMNVWDPMGNWSYDAAAHLIQGGYPQSNYGSLRIRQVVTNAFTIVDMNSILIPTSTRIDLEVGAHELIFEHVQTGCQDTLYAEVFCIGPDIIVDTILVNTTDTLCLTSEDLPGNLISVENACEDSSGEFVLFEIDGQNCISCIGMDIGTDSACIVLCDDRGICDTTFLYITVEELAEELILPIANIDEDTTLKNHSIDIVQSINDTINGTLENTYIVDQPGHGSVLINRDGTLKYTPTQDYCDDENPDSFTYGICNSFGCDTTTVYVIVQCDDLVVFTGFSPNGDGVNDTFKIQGIEAFPNNRLLIFNRWGNEVYNKEGYLNDWDGTWKNKLLPDGTYFYVLEDGEGKSYSGYVQIHR